MLNLADFGINIRPRWGRRLAAVGGVSIHIAPRRGEGGNPQHLQFRIQCRLLKRKSYHPCGVLNVKINSTVYNTISPSGLIQPRSGDMIIEKMAFFITNNPEGVIQPVNVYRI
jgi:hypothetical protein